MTETLAGSACQAYGGEFSTCQLELDATCDRSAAALGHGASKLPVPVPLTLAPGASLQDKIGFYNTRFNAMDVRI